MSALFEGRWDGWKLLIPLVFFFGKFLWTVGVKVVEGFREDRMSSLGPSEASRKGSVPREKSGGKSASWQRLETDEERRRRILREALGLPSQPGLAPKPPLRSEVKVGQGQRNVPPLPQQPSGQQQQQREYQDQEGPKGRAAELHFPEMTVAIYSEKQTLASQVSAVPEAAPGGVPEEAFPVQMSSRGGGRIPGLKRQLASAERVREAWLLKEILDQPRGLQS
jgi:hypothetical protein